MISMKAVWRAIKKNEHMCRWSLLAAVLLVCTVCTPVAAEKVNGFRGLNWGVELASLNGGEFERVPAFKGIAPGVESYRRKHEELIVAGVQVENIDYNFRKGKLFSISIDFRGFSAYEKLMAYCREQFGAATSSMVKNMEYVTSYESRTTGALLNYVLSTPQFSNGRLFIYPREFFE